MKNINEMNEIELYEHLKKCLPNDLFKEVYGDWKPEKVKQLSLFESSDESQGF